MSGNEATEYDPQAMSPRNINNKYMRVSKRTVRVAPPPGKDVGVPKPRTCARCKILKVKCEYQPETYPCKRCFNGEHECVIPERKKRRTLKAPESPR
ncbi:hypothetical protein DFH09DRAFT_1304153 [Mycena vulgaris]|nr:hypothetical protein DFH09DRAFT_1304153 [Mycena vulgaris]